ncbi:phage tail tape measure protein [Halopseudomonas sp.]|uniref:phage tail tape measure protein n=1 Tax=Halopseudomonas sp. TaxID=2901191 RepID=UPI0030030BCF
MARDLKLQVVLAAIDKATAPIKKVMGSSAGLAKSLKETRDTLKGLQTQQKDISSFKTLKGASEKTSAAMQANRDKVRKLSQQLANTARPTKALTNEFKTAVRQGHALKQKHGEQERALQELRTKLKGAGISTRNLGQHERQLRQHIAKTNQSLSRQEDRLKQVTRQQQRLANAKRSYQRTQGMASNMATTGAGGAATGGAMLYAGARMLSPGMEFDASMSQVQSLTRLDKNSEEMKALRAQARELGASTQFTAGDAAGGQGFLAMAGFSPDAIKKAMPGMLDLAKAGGTELAETADIASNILTGFGIGADQMGRVGDVLVGTFTRANVDLAMLGDTMKYAAPIAASLGQDIEVVAAMAGKLGDAGIQGSMGGTALRSILNRLSAPPKAAANALDELGISASDAQGNLRDMPEILTEIYEKTKDMGDTERAGLLKGIAGEEAVSALQVLVKQAGGGELQEFIGKLKQTEGEASKTARVMADNMKGDLAAMGSAWQDLGIELQEQQDGPLRETTQSITRLIGSVKGWVAENPRLVGGLIKLAAILAVLITVGGTIALTLASILGPLAMIRYGMTLFAVATNAATWPILAIIAAVALLAVGAYMLYKHWDKVTAFFSGIWENIKQAFSGGIGNISATLLNWSPLGIFYKIFAGTMSYFGVDLPGKFTEFGGMIIGGLVNGIKNAMGSVKTAITDAGSNTVGWFKEKLGIRSPSRVFAQLGDDTMAGLKVGLDRSQQGPLGSILKAGKSLAGAGAIALGVGGGTPALAVDNRAPLSASAPAAGAPVYHISVSVSAQPGMNEGALARLVAQEIQRATQAAQARQRSALQDNE